MNEGMLNWEAEAPRSARDVIGAWDDYARSLASITHEMLGAASYLEDNPDYATDEVLANAWRRYVAQIRAVEVPS